VFILTNNQDHYTQAGTNIDEVKRKNDHSGLTYNEAKSVLANALKNKEPIIPNQPGKQEKFKN